MFEVILLGLMGSNNAAPRGGRRTRQASGRVGYIEAKSCMPFKRDVEKLFELMNSKRL